ncbi:hypothetical protein C8Q79DRAFT_909308 [Trametes meyenii]|nr:hypothetical protein C8Q79DRAFT_909308 [Trametes meyenii]
MDPEHIANVAQRAECTHVHPGYGFLSESPGLASLLQTPGSPQAAGTTVDAANIVFVGPSVETLEIASDKMRSRELATSQGVPVAPGTHVSSVEDVRQFVGALREQAFPVVIKALDGGGGRGIRLVYTKDEIEDAFRRCVGESASQSVFVEKALVGSGWRHVEVQIVGDGRGAVTHLWERECSIQRRFQKVVEIAPSTLPREVVEPLLQAALKMAQHLRYAGLGTFEFLVNDRSKEWIFLEINPRIQVEHTVTEEITGLDLVRVQLLLSLPGASLAAILPVYSRVSYPPLGYAIQLRLVAEDPRKSSRLSTGTIASSDVAWPSGRGIRVDTWLCSGPYGTLPCSEWAVGVDFDSLLAKIVVHAGSFKEATSRAIRALKETRIQGKVQTNVKLLAGIIAHKDWVAHSVHTRWLEENTREVLEVGEDTLLLPSGNTVPFARSSSTAPRMSSGMDAAPGTLLLQPGVSFQLSLTPAPPNPAGQAQNHSLVLSSIGHNAFPSQLSGTISTSFSPTPLSFSLSQLSTITTSSQYEFANPQDPSHVASPLAGKVVELHPALASVVDGSTTKKRVRKGDQLVVVSVMKMESAVAAPAGGKVVRSGQGIQVGAVIGEGVLLFCYLYLYHLLNMSFMDEIRKIPPVTRFLCGSTLGVTLPVLLQIVSPYKVLFVKELVTQKFEVWRAFTSFFIGGSGINFVFDIAML